MPYFCFCITSLRHFLLFPSDSTFVDASEPRDWTSGFAWWLWFEWATVEEPEQECHCFSRVAVWGCSHAQATETNLPLHLFLARVTLFIWFDSWQAVRADSSILRYGTTLSLSPL